MTVEEPTTSLAATRTPYVDGLSFLEPGPFRQARLAAAICDVSTYGLDLWSDGGEEVDDTEGDGAEELDFDFRSFDHCVRAIRAAARDLTDDPRAFVAQRGTDVAKAIATDRTAVFFQMQGADPIGADLHRIELFHMLGLRVLQLTHHHDNEWAGGCMQADQTGLTAVGRDALARLEADRILVDLSHASDPTFDDVLSVATRPVIVSHTGPRALVDHPRCISDEMIQRVADTGGVVGIFMMSCWVTPDDEPTVEGFVRAVQHVADVGGVEHVGIANDFPTAGVASVQKRGNDEARRGLFPWWHQMRAQGVPGFDEDPKHVAFPGFNDIDRMARIHDALLAAGFSGGDAELVMGRNWMRVLSDVLG
jgi:membrane dipeptidase